MLTVSNPTLPPNQPADGNLSAHALMYGAALLVCLAFLASGCSGSKTGSASGTAAGDKSQEARGYLENELEDWQSKGTKGGDPLMRPNFTDKLLDYKIVSLTPVGSEGKKYEAAVNMK